MHHLGTNGEGCGRVAVADVMGHGPAVARTGAWMYRTLLDALEEPDDAQALQQVNREACARGSEAMTTALVAGFDVRQGVLSYANAGHLPILFHREDDMGWRVLWHVERRIPFGIPLGARPDASYCTRRVPLRPGDRFVLVTDGVTDVVDPDGRPFGLHRLRALLHDHRQVSLDDLLGIVVDDLRRFAADRLDHDDLTLLGVEIG